MLERLRQFMLAMNAKANNHASGADMKRLFVSAAAQIKAGRTMGEMASDLAEVSSLIDAEHSQWIDPAAIPGLASDFVAAGEDARPVDAGFNACDLRAWLALAEVAGVPFIPAVEVLSLTDAELEVLNGSVQIPNTPATRKLRTAALELAGTEPAPAEPAAAPALDLEALEDRLFALDDVPEGWMIRSNLSGSSDLKALAMVGIAEDHAPEVRFGANLEIGPGWIRRGNRRQVNVTDRRTIQMAAQGPGGITFLARPWQVASRYCEAVDPHRAGTPIAGTGQWPAEWRAIVENGQVVAVASYYGWSDTACPEAARQALAVRERAQCIADLANRMQLYPRYLDVELARSSTGVANDPELADAMKTRFGRQSITCTLDFIETDQGPMLLEGGPGVTPFGGGHPCAFAGVMKPHLGIVPNLTGVAFRTMPHVLMADITTWTDGDHTNCILSWGEVADLAAQA